LRERVVGQLNVIEHRDPAQVRLTVVDPEQTEVADYVHAFTYVEARRASAMNARLLNDLPEQLGVAASDSVRLARDVFAAAPACPLGGQYQRIDPDSSNGWRSTAWRHDSLADVDSVPSDYRFPFLNWLRGVEVQFALTQDTLQAHAILNVTATKSAMIDPLAGELPSPTMRPEKPPTPLATGDRVVVVSEDVRLRLGTKTLRQITHGTPLTVLEIRAGWIGVELDTEGQVVRGWVRSHQVRR
jgi:hypothetical protein